MVTFLPTTKSSDKLSRNATGTFLSRRNCDSSSGRYRVERKSTVYTKIGDKFGAKYIVNATQAGRLLPRCAPQERRQRP